MLCLVAQSRLCDPTRLLCPWDSPGKNTGVGLLSEPPGKPMNTGVGTLSLLQSDLPDPGVEPGSLALQADSLPAEHT